MFDSPYLLFRAESRLQPDGDLLVSGAGVEPVLMGRVDFELARLFDGTRSMRAVLEEARQRLAQALTLPLLQGFVADLGLRGLMRPGRLEPLPPPAQTDQERRILGWTGESSGASRRAMPPSTVPGSLVQPGLLGAVTFRGGDRPGEPARIDVPLRPRMLLEFGDLLVWPLRSRARMSVFLALCAIVLSLLYEHRSEWVVFSHRYLPGWGLFGAIALTAWVVNFFSMSARAAAVAHFTAERPRAGIRYLLRCIPYLFVDSSGAAERARLADRQRVVGAGLVGTAMLMVLGIVVWFLTSTIIPGIAGAAWSAAMASAISLLLRLNPLAQRDGYFLLANWLGVLDLRRQSMAAMFGVERPWMTQARRLPRRVLAIYGVLVTLFTVVAVGLILWFLGVVLEHRFQGTGVAILLGAWGVLMVKQYSRVAVERSSLGSTKKPWRPSRRQMIFAAVALVVCLLPYPYAPSGGFEVLPRGRADVRALTAGDVREVLVKEGDKVEADQAIVRIDDTAQRAKVAAAEAQLASLQADLALTRKGAKTEEIEVARQRVATARTTSSVADAAYQRLARAYRSKSVTAQDHDRARGAAEVAREELAEAERALDLVGSPAQGERIQSLEADLRRVQAELDLANEELKATRITAPIAGNVVAPRLMFSRGDYLERGELLATIEDTSELLAEIRMPESSVGAIAVDARVSAKFWAYPGRSFGGTVRSVAPNAEEGTYGRIVRVQVVILDPDGILRPGLTGNAKVSAGWQPVGIVFTRALVRFFMVEMWSWIP